MINKKRNIVVKKQWEPTHIHIEDESAYYNPKGYSNYIDSKVERGVIIIHL